MSRKRLQTVEVVLALFASLPLKIGNRSCSVVVLYTTVVNAFATLGIFRFKPEVNPYPLPQGTRLRHRNKNTFNIYYRVGRLQPCLGVWGNRDLSCLILTLLIGEF